ncbi:DBH-like monooxygenase protein 1 [Portunus trituberculatus]|uniref:DBH-like monooxygenase protein 1 n=1 Tax=Portunus trituberculatus TaxID=210409 RepID=UPI001E1D04E2|nr:DBH-like monooxygenase protein 1 [Portunus trituberculatus]
MKRNFILWSTMVVVVVVTATASQNGLAAVDFQHQAVLDQRGAFLMMWTPGKDSVTVEVQVATTGWVGVGFSPNGGMRGADITLGWVDSQGQLHVHDRYAHGMTIPVVDIAQNVVVEGGYQNDTHTVMRFSRPWNTCDTKHDMKLSDDTVRVIWAYGDEDPIHEMDMKHHVERGTKSMYLREPKFRRPSMTDDIKAWDIRAPNVSVPSHTDTLYWCKLVKVPDFGTKVHVIGFEPLISQENLPYVHHILLYSCGDISPHLEKWAQHDGVQCFSPNMPPSMTACKSTFSVAWAIGNEGEMWPEHTGIPLGDGSGVSYYVMEIHYDNPKLTGGIVDNSGLRLLYTEKLRKYDAGIIGAGHKVSPLMIVPPKHTWKTVAHCSGYCTQTTFPPEGIKVFQVFLHAHLLGRGLTVRHIREGRELPVISQDLNYDFNYQQGRRLPQEVTVLPGDSLIVECQYDARHKTVPTFGGEGTQEEMCLAFLMYYPKLSMAKCHSSPMLENLYRPLGVKTIARNTSTEPYLKNKADKKEKELIEALLVRKETPAVTELDLAAYYKEVAVMEPASLKSKTLYDILFDEETWNDERKLKKLQKRIEFSPHQGYCRLGDENGLLKSILKYPHFTTIKTLDDECLAPQVSPDHLPPYQDESHNTQRSVIEKEDPASRALQPAVILPSLLAPLLLLILFLH